MRTFLIPAFIFCFTALSGQTRHVRYDYNNGRILAAGKIVTCPGFDEKYPSIDSTFRKTGKWTYYYQNGKIRKTETYRTIKKCNSGEIKEGWWEYFNENEELIKKEEYKSNVLWTADIANYYYNTELAGKIQVRNGVPDTLNVISIDTGQNDNLIKNGNFSFYFGPPQLQISDGQMQLEQQIPFWSSPDSHTPDYYNPFRRLKNVPDNVADAFNDQYNYIGLILYHNPTGDYSEYITGELSKVLKANQNYCLKISIRLSQNSGFYINRLGAFFSVYNSGKANTVSAPQLVFSSVMNYTNEWKTICALFTASGDEKYITIGRFSGLDETSIMRTIPVNSSEGDYNQSAYYLINKLELVEDTTRCRCDFRTDEIRKEDRTIIE